MCYADSLSLRGIKVLIFIICDSYITKNILIPVFVSALPSTVGLWMFYRHNEKRVDTSDIWNTLPIRANQHLTIIDRGRIAVNNVLFRQNVGIQVLWRRTVPLQTSPLYFVTPMGVPARVPPRNATLITEGRRVTLLGAGSHAHMIWADVKLCSRSSKIYILSCSMEWL
jgi:hypothetical protein